MRKRLSKFYGTRYKNLHRYLRILRYVNWWIFLDSILKINPRKLAIKKHLVKIFTRSYKTVLFGQKNIVKKPVTKQKRSKNE